MRLREDQIKRLAEKVYSDLEADSLVAPNKDRSGAVAGIAKVIAGDFSREQTLERDAERILDESVSGMGRGAAEIDRRKMLRLIKEKLAKERKVVL
jgi:hypothetical protein